MPGHINHSVGRADMSNFLVHLAAASDDPYTDMLGILSSGRIEAQSCLGIGRSLAPNPSSQKAVCFSEIPLHLLERLARRRSCYGIVFWKGFAMERGANPILYAYQDQQPAIALRELMGRASQDANDPIWQVTPFVDEPGEYGEAKYRFEWEREWRCVGDFDLEPADVAFLIIPEEKHEQARSFFADAEENQLGPDYPCPYIDAYWNEDEVGKLALQVARERQQ